MTIFLNGGDRVGTYGTLLPLAIAQEELIGWARDNLLLQLGVDRLSPLLTSVSGLTNNGHFKFY